MEGPRGRLTVIGLIDSGADTSLMNSRYAELLGIALDDLPSKQFIGIGGVPVTTRCGEVVISVRHLGGTLHLPVAFTDSPSVDVLLGQEVFFDAYHIRFLRDDNLFEMEASRSFSFMEALHADRPWH